MQTTFHEIQRFNKWWHYVIAGIPLLFFCILFLLVSVGMIDTKDEKKDTYTFVAVALSVTLTAVWLLCVKLKTTINESGITAHFYGIPFCKRHVSWTDISAVEVVEYSPMFDYGGWGVKYSITGNGWCYSVSGNRGIKIISTGNKPFLIGTLKQEEAAKVLTHYFKS